MPDIQAVFVDLDDTFLAPDKSIPVENLQVMDVLAQRGIELVPCTGRHVGGVPQAMRDHPCVRHVVASNGGIVADARRGVSLRTVSIDTLAIVDLYQSVRDYQIIFDVFADGHAYSEAARRHLFDQIDVSDGLRHYFKTGRTFVEERVPDLLPHVGPVTKLSLFFVDEAGAAALRAAIAANPSLYYVQTSAANYEVMHTDATKGSALSWLCAHMGWDRAQVIAFGDNDNDLTMLEAAGDGVAMANATASAKAAADHEAPLAAMGGVSLYLRKLLG